jgi:hypothetical protein
MYRYILVLVLFTALAGCAEQIQTSMEVSTEVAVIASLRTLHSIESQFMASNHRYGTLEELKEAGLVNAQFSIGKGYVLTTVSADSRTYAFRADPGPENKLNQRHFYIDQTGIVRACYNRPAKPSDMPAAM